jgi:hypothetical protein
MFYGATDERIVNKNVCAISLRISSELFLIRAAIDVMAGGKRRRLSLSFPSLIPLFSVSIWYKCVIVVRLEEG